MKHLLPILLIIQGGLLEYGTAQNSNGGRRAAPHRSLRSAFPAQSGAMGDMAQLVDLDVKCSRTGMSVTLQFDKIYRGIVYSKGHYSEPSCHYVGLNDPPSDRFQFQVPMDACGTTGQLEAPTRDRDMYLENTIILQNDPIIQEVWDEARALRCTWQHTVQKSVDFLPFKVYEPDTVGVQLDSRSVNTLMEIQRGKGAGALSSPPTGYVHLGEEASVVMYLQDPTRRKDANVLSCNATSASGAQTVSLLDRNGCLLRPDLLTPFAKTTRTNGVDAHLMFYSYLKAFNIGESPEFVISCELEICENECPEPCAGGHQEKGKNERRRRRRKREGKLIEEEEEEEIITTQVSTSSSPKVVMEKAVMVIRREDVKDIQSVCWANTSSILLALFVLLSLVSCLVLLSCILGYKLWDARRRLPLKDSF